MKTVILGAGGQLAFDLKKQLKDWELVPLTIHDLDITDHDKVDQILKEIQPEVVINTAAFVRVDDCEEQMGKAFQVNAFAVRNLAQTCEEVGCTLVHISTDYVLGGEKQEPYTEEDPPNPLSVYGASKLAGEYFARNYCSQHIIVRSSGLYGIAGSQGKGGNFVETMLRLAEEGKTIRVVDDQVLTPTYTKDLARGIKSLLENGARGVYHLTNQGQCSWYEFAREIFKISGMDPNLAPTTSNEFARPAKRPPYSVLDNQKAVNKMVDKLPAWKDALVRYIAERS